MKIVVVVTTHPLYGVRPQAQASIDALDMTGHDVDVVYIDEAGIDNQLPHFDHLLEKHKKIPAIELMNALKTGAVLQSTGALFVAGEYRDENQPRYYIFPK